MAANIVRSVSPPALDPVDQAAYERAHLVYEAACRLRDAQANRTWSKEDFLEKDMEYLQKYTNLYARWSSATTFLGEALWARKAGSFSRLAALVVELQPKALHARETICERLFLRLTEDATIFF